MSRVVFLFFNIQRTIYSFYYPPPPPPSSPERQYAGNAAYDADEKRINDSKEAVDQFLKDIPVYSGLPKDRILFIVDCVRDDNFYSGNPDPNSYAAQMFAYFLENAELNGFNAIDMQKYFTNDYAINKQRFEFPDDGHWNSAGHRVAYEAIMNEKNFANYLNSVDRE
ncbi:MAG: hypothetical protein LBT81_04825 [Helicobacteraceae bacterium]|nr:hypothetical protein [Helicobacteraceae bacterium]